MGRSALTGQYAEQELALAIPLVQGLLESAEFRVWLTNEPALAKATHDPALQASLRSKTMKAPYWFNYFCGTCDGGNPNGCKLGTGTESDVLLMFDCPGSRLALHIEIKRAGDSVRGGQAETYPRRAACWANPHTRPRYVPPHDRWQTILAHGDSPLSQAEAASFARIVTHDDIRRQRPEYPR